MSQGLPRRNPYLNDAVEYLDQYLVRAKGNVAEAWSLLSARELQFVDEELTACISDARYYIENYHVVMTEEEGLKMLYPFWDSQEIIYNKVLSVRAVNEGRVKLAILKARQLGSSTLSEALIFHKTIFTKTCNTLIVAQDPVSADWQFSMCRRAYDALPWWMRPQARYEAKGRYLVFDKKDDFERQRHPGMQSQVMVEAANKMTGVARSKTIRCAHFTELASWPSGGILSQQIFPCMNASDTLAIMESTAEGRQGFWYDFWRETERGNTEWTPLFIEYYRVKKYSKPIPNGVTFELTEEEKHIRERVNEKQGIEIKDDIFNWVRAKKREFVALEGDEWKFYQEFPINPHEAFQASGICAFPKRLLQRIMERTTADPIWYGEISYNSDARTPQGKVRLHGGSEPNTLHRVLKGEQIPPAEHDGARFRIWEWPEEGADYYIGGDVAGGEGGDFSCAQIVKIGRGPEPDRQVAEWHGWINPTPFAYILAALGYWYNQAEISCECNDVGMVTNNELFRIIEYPQLYRWKHIDKVKNFITDFFGWWTNSKTRDVIIAKMREALMDGMIVLRSIDLVDQMMAFSRDENESRFEGQGTNDDRVFGMMIARYCAHDSDYGLEASAKPRQPASGTETFYIFDNLNRLRFQCHDRELAESHVRSHAGWSMRSQPAHRDFANTDFSPVHDKPGVRQELFNMGVPAEHIQGDLLLHAQMVGNFGGVENDWRSY